jgi:hypothetical protein
MEEKYTSWWLKVELPKTGGTSASTPM